MGQTPRDKTEPSLELPSFPGFGRRKKARKNRREPAATPAAEPEEEPPAPWPTSYDEPTRTLPEDHADAQHREPSQDGYDEPTGAPYRPLQAGYDEPTGAPYSEPAPVLDDTADAPLDDPTAEAPPIGAPGRRAKNRVKDRTETPAPDKPERKKTRVPRTTPLLPGPVAAALTGLVVGAAGAAGTYGAMGACKSVRGVSSCGGGPGFFILVAIVVLMVLLGTGVLKLFRVGDAGSTSFLAVGLVAVISMLVLLDVIFSAAMFVVIPLLSAVAFLLAHWVTTRFADDKGRRDWT